LRFSERFFIANAITNARMQESINQLGRTSIQAAIFIKYIYNKNKKHKQTNKPPPKQLIPQNSYNCRYPGVAKIPFKNSWIEIVIRTALLSTSNRVLLPDTSDVV